MPSPRPRRTRLIRALVLAAITLALITSLSASVLLPYSWDLDHSLPPTALPPTYIDPIAPPRTQIHVLLPEWARAVKLPTTLRSPVDIIEYEYGEGFWSPNYTQWDPDTSPDPTNVNLSRFRFGYPLRFVSYDDISTGLDINIPAVHDYHTKAYARAGHHRGLTPPHFITKILPVYRIPIAIRPLPLIANLIVWTTLWYALLSIIPVIKGIIRARRIKRAQCPDCAYQLNDLQTCPECGHPSTDSSPA